MSATIPELQQALDANPESWHARLELVEALVAESRHESAVEVVNNGQALPREPGPWLDAAKCYAAVGAVEQARSLVASSLEIDPEYEPALTYGQELEAAIAAMPVALSEEDVEGEEAPVAEAEEEEDVAAPAEEKASPPPPTSAPAPTPTAIDALKDGSSDEPITLPRVTFENHEMEALLAAEEESKRQNEATIKRDKMNSVLITVVLHVLIFAALISVATKTVPNVPPQIVASSAPQQEEQQIEDVKLEKPTVDPTTAVNSAVADIISVSAESNVSISNLDVPIADVAMESVVSFSPSMSLGMPTSAESKMMFGQPMEGDVLGVILDVSGSMAEYLPMVVREVDKNFKDAPVVYVRNMLIRDERASDESEIRLIYPEEVIPYNKELKTRTPYWFLWHDLPRKAPQRYVDRLIETFKTRPNQFISVSSHWNRSKTDEAIEFLMEQGIDSLYIFSDFEDFVDDDVALTIGQKLGRRKIKTYIQPAEKGTEFLDVMTKRIANRTLGRQMPPLVSILSGGGMDEDEPDSLLPQKPEKKKMEIDFEFTYAKPRDGIVSDEFFAFRPNKAWNEIHRIEEPTYTAVFYGPEARAYIFLKDANGKYIQQPIAFYYHSWKHLPDHPDPRYRVRRRKFLRLEEEPKFDGKQFTWNMILEDELKFEVQFYLNNKGVMSASYAAEKPEDGFNDNPYIYFRIPEIARENNDRYFGYDLPAEGVKLDDVRLVANPNEVIMDLPRELSDSLGKQWMQRGFEPGYNTRTFDELIRHFPSGIRNMEIKGPSFSERLITFRTTSNKVLLGGGAHRADTEPWEGFHASLRRPEDRREGMRKSEALLINIK